MQRDCQPIIGRRRRHAASESGFSLVEIAISILVLGLGFVSLLSVVTVGIKWSQDAALSATGQFAAETWKAKGGAGNQTAGSFVMRSPTGSETGDCVIDKVGKEFNCASQTL